MKNSKNKRTSILAVVLIGLLILAYKTMMPDDGIVIEENIAGRERVEAILEEIEGINFDIGIMSDPSFKSFKSIEIPLLSLPVGRPNPFSDI